HLSTRLAGPPADTGGERSADMLVELYRRACEQGTVLQAMGVLTQVALLRPSFSDPAELERRPGAVRLATGPAGPVLVCFTPYFAPSGVHQYARLSAPFRDRREVWALAQPGFAEDELLPAAVDSLV